MLVEVEIMSAVSLNAYSYTGIISGGHSKLYVPVKPQNVIYSHFEHVTGVAAVPGQGGVSISKIQILDSLLNQLISMKGKPKLDVATETLSNKEIDALIKTTQGQIQTTVQVAQATGYGLAGAAPQAGAIFSLDV